MFLNRAFFRGENGVSRCATNLNGLRFVLFEGRVEGVFLFSRGFIQLFIRVAFNILLGLRSSVALQTMRLGDGPAHLVEVVLLCDCLVNGRRPFMNNELMAFRCLFHSLLGSRIQLLEFKALRGFENVTFC